jgi:hypothetical protein
MKTTSLAGPRRGALALLAALALVGAAAPAAVDWTALESAVAAYVATPSDVTADGVTWLLPTSGAAALGDDPKELETRERIYRQIGKLEPLVLGGAPGAARVAFALGAISEGTFADLLAEALGASLVAHADGTLRALGGFGDVMGRGCRFASAGVPTTGRIAAVAELARRQSAVEAVTDVALRRPRACVVLEIGRAIDSY